MNKAPTYFIEQVGGLAVARRQATAYLESHGQALPPIVMPEIRVLTADKATLNKTFYPAKSLRGNDEEKTGVSSFTLPYPIPVIQDHNTGTWGESSDVYGRVVTPAQFVRKNGEGYIRATPSITHPEAIENILTGRWLTVSLGSRCESVTCSICGAELTEEPCDHMRGELYDGKEALWQIGPIKAKELSFVVTPSDDQAGILNPNVTLEAAGGSRPELAVTRMLVGDERGLFDLATGRAVPDLRGTAAPTRRLYALGESLHVAGSLSRKEKESMNRYAARLVDPAHRVEIDLYALPESAAALEAVLAALAKMPHTPKEREAITSRLAAHVKEHIPAELWESLFATLPTVEAGDPVEIAITAENYALLYAAAEHGADAPAPAATETSPEPEASETPEEPLAETETPAETPAETSEEAPVIPAPEEAPGTNDSAEVTRLRAALMTAESRAAQGLAAAAALYMVALKKPQAKGKSTAELAASLAARGSAALAFTLEDLTLEWDAAPAGTAELPRIVDPTATPVESTPAAPSTPGTEEKPAAQLSELEEMPLEEGETEAYLFTALFPELE